MTTDPPVALPAIGQRGSAWEVLFVFLRLGLTSFGGPIAHLGYFHDEFVMEITEMGDGAAEAREPEAKEDEKDFPSRTTLTDCRQRDRRVRRHRSPKIGRASCRERV